MMFTVQKLVGSARLGVIQGVEKFDYIVESPNVLLYTKGGTVPNITPDVFQEITKDTVVLHLPVAGVIHFHNRMRKFSGTIAEFIGMKGHLTYVSVTDPGNKRIPGYHTKNHLPVWSKSGKSDIDSKTYMDMMEAFQPDLFVTLYDADTESNSSNKRVIKSLDRTLDFFKECMEFYKNSEKLKKCNVIGPLVGGYNKEAREHCSDIVGKESLFGVLIDGLHDCGDDASTISIDHIEPMVEASLKHTNSDNLRICHGPWNPVTILGLISLGIDIFDTSYPYIVAERGGALTFPVDEFIFNDTEIKTFTSDSNSSTYPHSNGVFGEPSDKKIKISEIAPSFYISLREEKYSDCLEPVSRQCSCLTCKTYTKAYIHHLLNVKELLGSILLTVHNLHHYFQFFKVIRMAIKSDKFENMRNNMEGIFRKEVNLVNVLPSAAPKEGSLEENGFRNGNSD